MGDETIAILSSATRVEVFRVDPKSGEDPKRIGPQDKLIDGFAIRRVEKEQGREFAASLSAAVLNERAHFGDATLCFDPGVAYRAWSDKGESVDVVVCFYCSNLEIIAKDTNGTLVKKVRSEFYSQEARPAFVRLAKQAFPDDPKVQRLTDARNPAYDLLTTD